MRTPSKPDTGAPAPTAAPAAPANDLSISLDHPLPEKGFVNVGKPRPPAPPFKARPALPDAVLRLPNARVGMPFDQDLVMRDAGADKLVYCEITLPPELGLTADLRSGTLQGTPLIAGEYRLAVGYHYASQSPAEKRLASVTLVVIPDPKSMWQDLPSDQQDPYWKPDQACEAIDGNAFQVIAASKRGRSHAHAGSFRDDDFRIAQLVQSGWSISVVADGAGSAKFSRRGAALICERAMRHLQTTLDGAAGLAIDSAAQAYATAIADQVAAATASQERLRQTLHNSVYLTVGHAAYYALKAIADECASHADKTTAIKDYASTALIAACKRYDFGTLCIAYWVGDGVVAVYSKSAGVTLLGEVDSGEYSGQTRFLDATEVTQEALLKRCRFVITGDLSALVLMTDGVSDPKFETEERLAQAVDWDAFWNGIEPVITSGDAENKLLAWLDFWAQGNHDDRTIAVIRPLTAAGA
ncbi:MAG: hypothetical protein ACI9ZF_001410 [Bradyrhizobium sp.]|jgi:hypothetical protein